MSRNLGSEKLKKLIQAIILFACFGIGITAHASLITETWSGNVIYIQNNSSYSYGDTVFWDVTYEDTSTTAHEYDDGPDEVAVTTDDTLIATYDLSSFPSYSLLADAVFDFGDIFANLLGSKSVANVWDFNHNWKATGTSNIFMEHLADSQRFRWEGSDGFFYKYYYLGTATGPVLTSRIAINNLSLIETRAAVPEPASVALLGLSIVGLLGLGFVRKKRMNNNKKKRSE